ncbi:unnamed protein product [Linum trigynum]|uniref:Uncharacterized protein n=1 Tax=Linum trigynum TaxID=586398 RepID=A0AAV2GEV7_9ROSI
MAAESNFARNILECCLTILYVVFAFCSALLLGAVKAVLVGPIAASILIFGNIGVILGTFPLHVFWTVYSLANCNRLDVLLKAALFLVLPALLAIWLGLSIAGSVLIGLGYGFFTPWISTFEAFRHGDGSKKLRHVFEDGTWGTVLGSCTVVRDFADMCYHSYLLYMKELRDSSSSHEVRTLRLIHLPGFIVAGLLGLLVDIPLFTMIAIVKSPYMLFKGWFRLIHDLVSREGPFLETACIPVAGLTIFLWPLAVAGSILMAVFSSIFIGLYASVVVYQEKSFLKGVSYVIAMVAEFDEYTNDWLYLREGTFLPKPRYRKKKAHSSSELSVGGSTRSRFASSAFTEAPAMLVPSLAPSRSVRETIQEVKMIQVWEHMMKTCETRGKELLDSEAIKLCDLTDWLKAKSTSSGAVIGVGLPCYSMLLMMMNSIRAGSDGFILHDGVEMTHLNRPNDALLDWFFHPLLVLKDQIKAIKLEDGEARFLQKLVLFGDDSVRMDGWENGSVVPLEAMRAAQIQGISRRMMGMARTVSKYPTYRRRYRQVVKTLIAYSAEKDGVRLGGSSSMRLVAYSAEREELGKSSSVRSVACIEEV